jgi:hypothetical protein
LFLALLLLGGEAFAFDTTAVLVDDAVSTVGQTPVAAMPIGDVSSQSSSSLSSSSDDEDEVGDPAATAANGEVVDENAILNFFLWRFFCFDRSRLASASRRSTS